MTHSMRSGGRSGDPPSSCTLVSFQRARVFSQKIASVTASRPSPVALRYRFSATLDLAGAGHDDLHFHRAAVLAADLVRAGGHDPDRHREYFRL